MMGTVIYSANPLQAMSVGLATAGILLLIGLVGIGTAVLRSKQRAAMRVVTGGFGLLLLIAGCITGLIMSASLLKGSRTLTLQLGSKNVAEQSCGDNGETCPQYVLSATTGGVAYDFDVPQSAYDAAQLNVCYTITYYPRSGFAAGGAYQTIDSVTRIETADPTQCK
jgi:hypothetical protein